MSYGRYFTVQGCLSTWSEESVSRDCEVQDGANGFILNSQTEMAVLTLDTRSLASADIVAGNQRSTLAMSWYVSASIINCVIPRYI